MVTIATKMQHIGLMLHILHAYILLIFSTLILMRCQLLGFPCKFIHWKWITKRNLPAQYILGARFDRFTLALVLRLYFIFWYVYFASIFLYLLKNRCTYMHKCLVSYQKAVSPISPISVLFRKWKGSITLFVVFWNKQIRTNWHSSV